MNPFENFNYTADFTWSERNFPNQRALSYLWAGSSSSDYEVALNNLIFKFGRLSDPREKFLLEEPDNWTIEQMASSPIQGAFFAFLANSIGSKRILEIGTFVGVTTMLLAQNLPVEGMVVSIEKSPGYAEIARRNFERNGFGGRIQVLIGELPSLVAARTVQYAGAILKKSLKYAVEVEFSLPFNLDTRVPLVCSNPKCNEVWTRTDLLRLGEPSHVVANRLGQKTPWLPPPSMPTLQTSKLRPLPILLRRDFG